MRSFQVMRYGRRTTPTVNELTQSIIQSNSLISARQRRSSMFIYDNEHQRNSIQNDENVDLTVHRRQTLNVQKSLTAIDGINLARRSSFNNNNNTGRRLSFQQQEVTESSKSKTNLRNFYVFFISLFLFIFLAVVYSFIRMIKNQTS